MRRRADARLEFYRSRQEGEADLLAILVDEPSWALVLSIVKIEYSEGRFNVSDIG